ncbi:RloB-like protein [Kandleria vitulina]|uniref:RloB family protein n=1 Tax=Kandleria vitulina TaxID=1630 RepID=UPI0008B6DBB3|nr:RloB family protein [Kandleria vitulina]SEJ28674.1 RloB-like protein [Kandleria vitulina]
MTRKERNGKRKSRRINSRNPSLGYYLIVTDTNATERNYFMGLQNALPEGMRNKLIIHVEKAKKTDQLIKRCVELLSNDPQYRIPWIVFDRDQVTRFDNIIVDAKKRGIHVGWSNPCFEVWMYGYFGKIPQMVDSQECCRKFVEKYKQKTGQEYKKNDVNIYKRLTENGDEKEALNIARRNYENAIKNINGKPSDMHLCTTVYELVGEIVQKASAYKNKLI